MSEYLNKKAVLEWLDREKEEDSRDWEVERVGAYLNVIEEIQSGTFDADISEIQRLRAALTAMRQAVWDELVPIKLVTKINKIADEALFITTEPTDAAKVERFECPCCGCEISIKPKTELLKGEGTA